MLLIYSQHCVTLQFSKMSSQVSLPLIPSLSSFWAVENPSIPFSIKKAVIPRESASGRVFAYTIKVSACNVQ